ncbi:MAG: hypothetical protein HYY24_18115 [Verrucomicrobia bacterium]|nr:hypothetical protein [Verrucomicrobiota bacterium]
MNSPSSALVWEVWRRNRWGFVVLISLLAVCVGLSICVRSFKSKVARVGASFFRYGGSLRATEVLPSSPTGVVAQTAQITLGTNVIYFGLLSAGDTLWWTGLLENAVSVTRLSLNATNFYDGSLLGSHLTLTMPGGRQRRLLLADPVEAQQQFAFAAMRAETWRNSVLAWSAVFMGFSFLVVFGIFGCAEPHAARGFTGIPPRRFTLPVKTGWLVAWPVALGCSTILVLYFGWSRLVLPPRLPAAVKVPDLYFAALLPAGLVVFQALVWGLASFPKTRICVITALILGLIPLAALPFVTPTEETTFRNVIQPLLPGVFAAVWLAGFAAAWLGVRQERRGGWGGARDVGALAVLTRELRPRPLEFGSALHAQFWIEWRRNARLPLGLWTLMVVVVLAVDVCRVADPQRFGTFADIALSCGILAAPFWVLLTGLNLARDAGSKRLALSSFTATRPVQTGVLLSAKLLAGGVIWTLGLAILGLAFLASVAARGGLEEFPHLDVPELAVMVTVSLHFLVGILPLCLTGRIAGFPWSLLPLLIIYGAVLNASSWLQRHTDYFSVMFFLLLLLVLAKLGVAFWGFRRAIGLRCISPRLVAVYVALWLVATAVLVEFAVVAAARASWGNDALFLLPAAVVAVPLARIAVSPLALAMNRHR